MAETEGLRIVKGERFDVYHIEGTESPQRSDPGGKWEGGVRRANKEGGPAPCQQRPARIK